MFTLFAVVGLTLSVSAQKDDKKPRPPKDPPKVEVPDKNRPRENPPPKDQKPKKPGSDFELVVEEMKSE